MARIDPYILIEDERTKVVIRDGGPGGFCVAEIYYQAGADGVPKYNASMIALWLADYLRSNSLLKNPKMKGTDDDK